MIRASEGFSESTLVQLLRAREVAQSFWDLHVSGRRMSRAELLRLCWRQRLGFPLRALWRGGKTVDLEVRTLGILLRRILRPALARDEQFSPRFRSFLRRPSAVASERLSAGDCLGEIQRMLVIVEGLQGPSVLGGPQLEVRRGDPIFLLSVTFVTMVLLVLAATFHFGREGPGDPRASGSRTAEPLPVAAGVSRERPPEEVLGREGDTSKAPLGRPSELAEPPSPEREELPAEERLVAAALAPDSSAILVTHWEASPEATAKLSLMRGETEQTMSFVKFPPGEFQMGTEYGELEERPAWKAKIDQAFFLATTETTRGQFRLVMDGAMEESSSELPMTGVTWQEAKDFCERAQRSLEPSLRLQVRIPREVEWEYAAQKDPAVFSAESNRTGCREPLPVLDGDRNRNGIYGLAGNVQEWVEDWYHSRAYMMRRADGPQTGQERVVRGGSCSMPPVSYTTRRHAPPDEPHPLRGFRVVVVGNS